MPETQTYETAEVSGDGWELLLGDSCERMAELVDDSVGLSCHSPPFSTLFVYSPSVRDIGNCGSDTEFLAHYRFVIEHLLRVTMPGRLAAVHVTQPTNTKVMHGERGLRDLVGMVICEYVDAGWIYHGDITIDKDPQVQAIRTKSQSLLFVQLERDSSFSRPALADYVILFRKPGENQVPVKPECDRETWIQWARPVWYGIRETDVLNVAVAREDRDERHICPLQLGLIDRVIRLWSNPGELVISPLAGIGSELYGAIRRGRRAWGCELKRSYFETAIANLRRIEAQMNAPTLFDGLEEPVDART